MADENNTDKTTENDESDDELNEPEDKSIIPAEITTEMQNAYLDYAMSVIVSRALPDVRDGLKPVQRRIIYAMQDQNMTADGRYHKCAAVVGDVLRRYHPHGDVAVYDALVRMGQDFSLRYPLIWGQGNFGSIDGDPPAAMRYTECKMQKISEDLYRDIDKETVDFEMNDLQNLEPIYLPSVLPNILLNGSSGIAVGMATNIPPHNLSEVIDGIALMLEKAEEIGTPPEKDDKGLPYELFDGKGDTINIKASAVDFSSSANVEDLIEYIKGPDFPTGGIIYNQKEIMQAYATGKGRIVTRAKTVIEEDKSGRMRILVTEIPYQVNKSTLMEKIADLVRNKKISGISDLRDESNREGMRIVIELKKEAIPQKVQNQLFKYSQLQSTFNANMVALIDREPKLMTLKMILEEFVKHRQEIVVRRTIFLLKKAKEREHILQGLKIALDNLDEVIKLIRNSPDVEAARKGLIKNFDLSEVQAQAILDMQLRRLAALERKKIEDELEETLGVIEGFEALLVSPEKIIETVKDELAEIKEKYGGERYTKVVKGKVGEIEDEDLIANKPCIITISESGYIKRLSDDTYRKQKRGGKGVMGQALKEEDAVQTIRTCETHDYAFFFTNKGKVYKMRVWDIPESSRTAKGTALVNFLNVSQDETVQAFLKIGPDDLEKGNGYVFFCTEKGIVKKTSLEDFANIRSSGIMAIRLGDDDNLVWARFTSGQDEILITTAAGQSIRFNENDVRPMGRVAAGVIGIKLTKKEDNVVGMVVIPSENGEMDLIVVSENGYGKKTSLNEYKIQNRGGSGILTYKVTSKTGNLVTGRAASKDSESDILIVTTHGKVIRLETQQIPELGRATLGVKLINLDKGDKASSVALFGENEED